MLIAGFILEINCSKSSGTCSSILGGSFSVCYDANVACLSLFEDHTCRSVHKANRKEDHSKVCMESEASLT